MRRLLALALLLLAAAPLRAGEAGRRDADDPRPAAPAPGLLKRLPVVFETDARVELLSAVLLLSDPQSLPSWSYADFARRRLAPLSGHRAVAATRELLQRSKSDILPMQILLHLGPPPALKPLAPVPDGHVSQAGGEAALEEWLSSLRDFSARHEYSSFWSEGSAAREKIEARARAEAERHFDPARVAAYLRLGWGGRQRYLLAALLPPRYAANARPLDEELRVRSSYGLEKGEPRFGFDIFSSGLPHELAHVALDPSVEPYRARLPLLGPHPRGCVDGWSGCVVEQVVFAVTLRSLAAGDKRAIELYASRGFPHLEALCRALEEEYERAPERYATLRDFYPNLIAVFGLPPASKPEPKPKPLAVVPPVPAHPREERDTTRALRDQGVAAFQAGRAKEAEALFRRAVAERPSDAEAWLDLGVVLGSAGRLAEALRAHERCLALARRSGDGTMLAEALSSRAGYLASAGRESEARADREAALSAAPPDWRRRGEVTRLLGR